MNVFIDILIKSVFSFLMMLFFYKYFKAILYRYSGRIAVFLKLSRQYSYEVAKGFIELPLIVGCHFIFCVLMLEFSGVGLGKIGLQHLSPPMVIYGFLLGIGVMGTSSMLGRLYIEGLKHFFPDNCPANLVNWLAMARSGWIRHHFHTLEVLPVPLALMITFGQVFAEEVIFRGILINIFLPYGKLAALGISTLLFMLMQIFHMPNRLCAVFPVIGALVMGVVGGILYLQFANLWPLIIAHITFFAVAVL